MLVLLEFEYEVFFQKFSTVFEKRFHEKNALCGV